MQQGLLTGEILCVLATGIALYESKVAMRPRASHCYTLGYNNLSLSCVRQRGGGGDLSSAPIVLNGL